MEKRKKRLVGGVALALGALGAVGAILIGKGKFGRSRDKKSAGVSAWARPGMKVVFRAELMPGRDPSERIFQVAEILPSGRVTLEGVAGEHAETEFERVR
jgi:hypothetical protein